MANKSGSLSKGIVWIIILLLIVGLGGFGISNFGGSVQSVGSVGDREIGVDEYYRALQQEVRVMSAQTGQQLTLQQANQFSQFAYGVPLTDRVLTQLITTAALNSETGRLGISVGDEEVRKQLLSIQEFQGLDGNFDRETYRFALQQVGLNERDYETRIREDSSRGMLQAAIIGGVETPIFMRDQLVEYAGQRRSFNVVRLGSADLSQPPAQPSEADLTAFYEANPEPFTSPPVKRITYVWITPDMLLDTVEVDEDALQALYDERSAEFNVPERRLVERLVFPNRDEAETAVERMTAGEIDFDGLVAERGLGLADIDMGDVAITDLALGAASAVFAMDGIGITEVVESALGPAIFRVNAVLDAQITPFEEAREELMDEFATDRARRVIDGMVTHVEDLLAGGATLEEVAEETDLELGQIDWWDGLSEGISAYDDFRIAARRAIADDFAEIAELDDGGIFAIQLEEEIEAQLKPFAEVRIDVEERWTDAETLRLLTVQAEAIADQLRLGVGADDLGLQTEEFDAVTRDIFVDDAPAGFAARVFSAGTGEVIVAPSNDTVFVALLSEVLPPDFQSDDVRNATEQISEQLRQDIAQDIYIAFARDLERAAGLTINQAALNAVHTQMP